MNKQTKGKECNEIAELFVIMQHDVDMSHHLSNGYLKQLENIISQAIQERDKEIVELKNKAYREFWWILEKNDQFIAQMDVSVMKVNPQTDSVDDNNSKNTKVQYWIETGDRFGTIDPNLECGGDSFEEAVISLARLIRRHYQSN